MARADELFDLVTKWEHEKRTEKEIIKKFSDLIMSNKDDIDLYFDINDALHWKGYSYQFAIPKEEKYEWDSEEYAELVTNVTKSKEKTKELCIYLSEMDLSTLTISSLHFIKMKHLINLGVYHNVEPLKPIIDMNIYDAYMMCYSDKYDDILIDKKYIKTVIEKFLMQIGLQYIDLDYMQFRMEMEYLLWTITQTDKTKDAYKKINTIKVAFCIADKEYFMWNDKIYFSEDIHKNLVKYLSYIDKNEAKKIYDKYKDSIHLLDDTGYKLLFNML